MSAFAYSNQKFCNLTSEITIQELSRLNSAEHIDNMEAASRVMVIFKVAQLIAPVCIDTEEEELEMTSTDYCADMQSALTAQLNETITAENIDNRLAAETGFAIFDSFEALKKICN